MPIYFRNAPVREPFIYDSIGNHWLQDATSRPNGYPFYHYLPVSYTHLVVHCADMQSGEIFIKILHFHLVVSFLYTLVEMCIRDRSTPAPSAHPRGAFLSYGNEVSYTIKTPRRSHKIS